MEFQLIPRGKKSPDKGRNTVYLNIDFWNDFSYITMFYVSLHDDTGEFHELGNIKIGFRGQTTETSTFSTLEEKFLSLSQHYFSLGQDVSYYQSLFSLPENIREEVLVGLKDIVHHPFLMDEIIDEPVFKTSLMRDVSRSVIKGQYARVLDGYAALTDYDFTFVRPEEEKLGGIELRFRVKANSIPSTNIHCIIGRNGVGKTTLLNAMTNAITDKEASSSNFIDHTAWEPGQIDDDYFSSLVSVAFSAFDPFQPPKEQADPTKGTCYFYVGLKQNQESLKSLEDIHQEFTKALAHSLSQPIKRERWIRAIEALETDDLFASMNLISLADSDKADSAKKAMKLIQRMSSGHAIVILTITKLVATVEEKTLVLIDEPESHLHPPLLSAFLRALSDLLYDRNAVAIIATHSPVVLQEIPRSCAWKIDRAGKLSKARRPDIETFGENVGILTREVFGLEVIKSGFHSLLQQSVQSGASFHEIVDAYDDQLGYEARSVLQAMVSERDRGNS